MDDDVAPFSITINGVAVEDPNRREVHQWTNRVIDEFFVRDRLVADQGRADIDYLYRGDGALDIPDYRRPAVGLTIEDGAYTHRFANFISAMTHFGYEEAGYRMGGTAYQYDGRNYDDPLMGLRAAQFTSVLWNGQRMDAFGHIIADQDMDAEDSDWDRPPSDGEDGDDNSNDGTGGGEQGSGEDPNGESGGWGRPRPRFCDLLSDDQDGVSGGQSSREPTSWERYHQDVTVATWQSRSPLFQPARHAAMPLCSMGGHSHCDAKKKNFTFCKKNHEKKERQKL